MQFYFSIFYFGQVENLSYTNAEFGYTGSPSPHLQSPHLQSPHLQGNPAAEPPSFEAGHNTENGFTMTNVGKFFDVLSDDYTATIERCFPRYREMLWAILDYLPTGFRAESILELGAGTGNLTVLVQDAFPDATVRAVDVSAESLDICQNRVTPPSRLEVRVADIRELEFDEPKFDLIVSSIAIHHLEPTAKRELFSKCRRWLRPGGIFTFADQFRGVCPDVYQRHLANWRELSINAGSTQEEWQMWMEHQENDDHHDPLPDQLSWLAEAGFSDVDCVWRYLLWAVVQGRAASES